MLRPVLAVLIPTCILLSASARAGVCNGTGNLPRLSASALDFGRLPGLAGPPVQSSLIVVVSCPRAGDALPPFRVIAQSPPDGPILGGPGSARLGPWLLGASAQATPGGTVLHAQPSAIPGGRASFVVQAQLPRGQGIVAGAYHGLVTLQLRLD